MIEYDPYDYKFHDDPYPVYRQLRDHAPAYHNPKFNFWALSRYHDCQHAVRDFKTFSSAQGTSLEELKAQLPTLINSDPPIHTRLRHLIAGMFTPEKLAPALREVLDDSPLRRRQVEAFAGLDSIMTTGDQPPGVRAADIVLATLRKARG